MYSRMHVEIYYYYGVLFLFGAIHQRKRPSEPLISFTLISLNKPGRLNRFDGTSHAHQPRTGRIAQKNEITSNAEPVWSVWRLFNFLL